MENKKSILIILLVVCIAAAAAYTAFGMEPMGNSQLKKAVTSLDDGETVMLNEVVPFDWDKVVSFPPYTSKEKMAGDLGIRSFCYKDVLSEGMVQLVFIQGQQIMACVTDYAENTGYSIEIPWEEGGDAAAILYEENAKYKVVKDGDITRLVFISKEDSKW